MLSRIRKSLDEKGFTLMELLIIIAIIGILSAIAIPQYSAYQQRMFSKQTKDTLQSFFLSCKAYWADNGASAECTSAAVANKTYGFTKSNKVTITENATTESDFSATAVNSDASKVTYAIDSQGTIIKK